MVGGELPATPAPSGASPTRDRAARGLAVRSLNRERSMKNLIALEHMAEIGADVHLITQLITTLQALIVFPKERAEFGNKYKVPLPQLQDWPAFHHEHQGKVSTLADLLIAIRHSISHAGIRFSSESRRYEEVHLTFFNLYKKNIVWEGSINALELRTFCFRLCDFILHG
jgi:hypothetical protein